MARASQVEEIPAELDADTPEELSTPIGDAALSLVPQLPLGRILAGSVSHLALPVPKAVWYVLPPAARSRKGSHTAASIPLPAVSPVVAAHVAGDEFARARLRDRPDGRSAGRLTTGGRRDA